MNVVSLLLLRKHCVLYFYTLCVFRKQEEESLQIALEMSRKDNTGDEQEEEEETPDDSNTGDLLGNTNYYIFDTNQFVVILWLIGSLADPWAGGNELPPSYDLVTGGPADPFVSKDPFAPPTTTANKDPFAPPTNKDPFAPPTSKDPFAPPPVSGPWGIERTSPPPIGFSSDIAPPTRY